MTAGLAVGETVILLHHPLPVVVGVSVAMERGRQSNDSLAAGSIGTAALETLLAATLLALQAVRIIPYTPFRPFYTAVSSCFPALS